MKKFMYVLIMAMTLNLFAGCSAPENTTPEPTTDTASESTETKVYHIGISQLVEHPSLDAIRTGVIDAIHDGGFVDGENIEIDYLNSQGSIENTNTIANEFASDKYDLVVGITTPSTQALFNKVKDAPIVYTAITDPVTAGLVGDSITGVSDLTPVRKQLDLLMELLPDTKSVGMIYNSGELNSEIQVNIAIAEAEKMGLDLQVKGITNSNEIALALDAILDKVDVLYIHKDNTVASAFPVVVKKANAKNIPIIGAVKDFVDQGALATDGPSEYNTGYQAGEMVVQVLTGTPISTIEPQTVTKTKRDFNTETAARYGIELPEEAAQ